VLAKYLIDEALPSTSTRSTCYYFFKDDFEDQKSASNALCATLRQILLARPDLLSSAILEKLERDGDKFAQSFHDLWTTFASLSADSNAGEIVCILDALDECAYSDRSLLIKNITTFFDLTPSQSKLRFLLTSRPYGHIKRAFGTLERRFPIIHLSGEDEVEIQKISKEVDIVIKQRVKEIRDDCQLESEECKLLVDQMMLTPNPSYLWANLALEFISGMTNFTKTGIRKAISKIPPSVDSAYEKLLSRSSDRAQARELLHIVVGATRPLTVAEVSMALAINVTQRTYADVLENLEPEERFKRSVRDLCGLFVVIIDSRVYLFHQTARSFLIQSNALSSPRTTFAWRHSLQQPEWYKTLAEKCICYLSLDSHGSGHPVLLDYAVSSWVIHFRQAGIRNETSTVKSAAVLCDPKSKSGTRWLQMISNYSSNANKIFGIHFHRNLPIAAFLDYPSVLELLLKAEIWT
jgi:hypothetical protein